MRFATNIIYAAYSRGVRLAHTSESELHELLTFLVQNLDEFPSEAEGYNVICPALLQQFPKLPQCVQHISAQRVLLENRHSGISKEDLDDSLAAKIDNFMGGMQLDVQPIAVPRPFMPRLVFGH